MGRAPRSSRALCALALVALLAAPAAARPPIGDLEERIIAVAERVKPSVVHIEAIVRVNDRRNQVTGSGVIVSADGRILTNEHVVDRAEKITVSVPGHKKKYAASVVGADKQTDVALLRIEPDAPLQAAEFGRAEEVRVGQWVVAVGNPYGLDGTVSLGIVSAKGRNLEIPDLLNDFIQTDAMIDRGSSGGPLVDLEGRVVGINSRGRGRGIGFTIPVDTAREVMAQLEEGGIERGYLGISMQPLDRELADYLGMPDVSGVVVNSVVEGSPAERAGLRPGDVITHVAGTPLEAEKQEDLGNLQRLVAGVPPGRVVELRLRRDGNPETARVEISAQPKLEGEELESEVGFHVREITSNLARNYRLETTRGVFVYFVARASPAREAGLRVGDVVEGIDDASVDDLEDFRRAIGRAERQNRFLIRARRGEDVKFLLVKPGAPPLTPQAEESDPGEAAHLP